jgi:hypothetical protein
MKRMTPQQIESVNKIRGYMSEWTRSFSQFGINSAECAASTHRFIVSLKELEEQILEELVKGEDEEGN